MNPHKTLSRLQNLKPTVLAIMLLTALVAVCAVSIVPGTAQSAQDEATEERKFENTIPAHVPLKVKLKNEQSFKNPKNKNWARELEIEVKNTGSKPIYYLYLLVDLPDVISPAGYPYAIQIHYGRKELIRLTTPLQAGDLPILPGESYTLKIPERQVIGYESSRDKEKRADTKRVKFEMQLINFGDGTGLRGMDGRPTPEPNRKQPSNVPNLQGVSNNLKPPRVWRQSIECVLQLVLLFTTREVLAGKFFSAG